VTKDESLPFACLLCKTLWNENSNPIVTKCRHYFCEKCAFGHYAKSKKCFTCGMVTNGIFNSAEKLLERIERRGPPVTKDERSDDEVEEVEED